MMASLTVLQQGGLLVAALGACVALVSLLLGGVSWTFNQDRYYDYHGEPSNASVWGTIGGLLLVGTLSLSLYVLRAG